MEKPKFNVNDKVYLLRRDAPREGPYRISSVPSAGKYTLSLENGKDVEGGKEFRVDALEAE